MMNYSPAHGLSSPHGTSSHLAGSAGSRRRLKPDSDNEMLRELVKAICECLFRSRSPRLQSGSTTPQERVKRTKWFGIVSDKVTEVERLMTDWTPHVTTILSVYCDSVLLECWSIRYNLSFTAEPARGRIYSRLMVLVRSLICVAQALPTSRSSRLRNDIQVRFCDTDGEAFDIVPPLAEEFCFPAVEMGFGTIQLQVRYRLDEVMASFAIDRKDSSGVTKTNNILSQSIVEDYIGGGRRASSASDSNAEPFSTALTEEEDADNRRWRRWASESFDEREKELNEASSSTHKDEEEEELEVSPPPDNKRVSSNPMAIPQSKSYGESSKRGYTEATGISGASAGRSHPSSGTSPNASSGSSMDRKSRQLSQQQPQPKRKLSAEAQYATSAPVPSSMSRLVRKSSGLSGIRARLSGEEVQRGLSRPSSSFGYSIADLVGGGASSVAGTPILSSLPFAVGSMTSSVTSDTAGPTATTPSSLRARFLTGIDMSASASSPPFPVPFMSAGSLMISRHSSALALLGGEHPSVSPSPQPGYAVQQSLAPTPPPLQPQYPSKIPSITQAALAQQVFHEVALPWVLTPGEMERPFSSMGNSVTLGLHLDEGGRSSSPEKQAAIKQKRSANEIVIEDEDELALPFVADEDSVGEDNEAEEYSLRSKRNSWDADNSDLGAFVRRCREDRKLFTGPNETVKIDEVKKQLETLMQHAGLDRTSSLNPPEVVTVYEERAL